MPELKWTRDRTYFDGQRGFRAEGPGIYDVPEGATEEYLNHRSGGWERVDEEDADTGSDGSESNSNDETEPDQSDDDSGSDSDDEAASEPDADGESEVTPEEIASSDDWRWAIDMIESGAVDGQLDATEAAEEERENGPRDSVLTALDDRREA